MSAAAAKPDPAPLTVSQVLAQARAAVETKFQSVWVVGEVSGFTKASSGHWYFTLKEDKAQLRAAMFRGFNLRAKFDPKNGMQVLARGKLSVYAERSECQLVVEEVQPKGIGAAELGLRQLKEKLLQKGYFDPKRKRPLPKPPRRVALVASPTGAAVRDLIEVFAQRWPFAELVLKPSRVQGAGAAAEIALALKTLNWLHGTGALELDAIVLGRGGGSAEDLWAFNEEPVADAIYFSRVPVVSAVGHETDVTVADLVADFRAETPTAAVVALTPDRRELLGALGETGARLHEALGRRIGAARQRLDLLAARPALRKPLQRVRDLEQRLDGAAARLERAVQQRLGRAAQEMESISARLESLSPLQVLARGYSLTHTPDGTLVRDPAGLRPGDVLLTRVAAGTIRSLVTETASARAGRTNKHDRPAD